MITELTENSIAVECPQGAKHIHVEDLRDGEFRFSYKLDEEWTHIPVDEYYTVLGRPKELTEEQWKAIILRIDGDLAWIPSYNDPDSGGHGFCYDDYESEDEHAVYYTATESGLSLLKYKNVPIDNVIILVKVK